MRMVIVAAPLLLSQSFQICVAYSPKTGTLLKLFFRHIEVLSRFGNIAELIPFANITLFCRILVFNI